MEKKKHFIVMPVSSDHARVCRVEVTYQSMKYLLTLMDKADTLSKELEETVAIEVHGAAEFFEDIGDVPELGDDFEDMGEAEFVKMVDEPRECVRARTECDVIHVTNDSLWFMAHPKHADGNVSVESCIVSKDDLLKWMFKI